MNNTTHRLRGIMLVIIGAAMWGATGPMMEWVLSSSDVSVSFLLTIRLLVAGIGLLLFLFITKKNIFAIWRESFWWKKLILFSIFGMLGVQFTFVAAINASNATVATLLQFLAPIFIILFVSISKKRFPPKFQLIGIFGTLFGLFLLLTNGSLANLLISNTALLWGLGVGLTFAFYTLYPSTIMNEWGVLIVVGWGMFTAGLLIGIVKGFWEFNQYKNLLDSQVNWVILLIILIGTLAFVFFLSSLKYISPVETSILSSMEPLTAMVISVIWLGQVLGFWQVTGSIIMLVCVTWLSIEGNRQTKQMKNKLKE